MMLKYLLSELSIRYGRHHSFSRYSDLKRRCQMVTGFIKQQLKISL